MVPEERGVFEGGLVGGALQAGIEGGEHAQAAKFENFPAESFFQFSKDEGCKIGVGVGGEWRRPNVEGGAARLAMHRLRNETLLHHPAEDESPPLKCAALVG